MFRLNEIEELQMKVAFQDNTIEALNQAIITQQKQIEKLNFQIQHMTNKLIVNTFVKKL